MISINEERRINQQKKGNTHNTRFVQWRLT